MFESRHKPNEQLGHRSKRRRSEKGLLSPMVSAMDRAWQRILALEPLWILLFLVVGTLCLAPPGLFFTTQVEVGTIASRDYVATRDLDLPDEETTLELKQRARSEILPIYDHDPGVAGQRDAQLSQLFAAGRDFLAEEVDAPEEQPADGEQIPSLDERLWGAVQTASGLTVSAYQLAALKTAEFGAELEDHMRSITSQVLRKGVVGSKAVLLENRLRGITLRNLQTAEEKLRLDLYAYLGYPDDVDALLEAETRRWPGLSRTQHRLFRELLVQNIPPNITRNQSETLNRGEAAAEATAPVFNKILKGQIIVRKGDEIGDAAVRILEEMEGDRGKLALLLPLLGNALLLCLVTLILWLALHKDKLIPGQPSRVFGGVLLLLLIMLVVAKLGFVMASALADSFENSPFNSEVSYVYAIPFATLALVTFLLYGRNTALLLSVVFSLVLGRLAESDSVWVLVYALAGSLAAIYSMDQFKQRTAVTRAALVVGLGNMVASLMLIAFANQPTITGAQISFDLACAFLGGLLVGAAASFSMPVLESLLSVTTDLKLLELSDTNRPLLRRLAFEAPGTFQHSLMVANLAKSGCEIIGANPVLAYTGALYHDIGKVLRPEYFVENQRPGHNRHDKLAPSMSALIVINHVKEGAELARQNRLPKPILDAIEQHHGTRLLSYFFNRAKEKSPDDCNDALQVKYRYPGPKPQDKVMGVLMLADSVEAASRTLVDPTPTKVRTLLRKLFQDCLKDGQLDQTDLTLGDVNKVSDAFLRVLTTIMHRRIDYPGFDFNSDAKEPRFDVLEGAKVS